ncbi:MAG: metallophosphoesterase family protein [Methanobacterium sp.]
MKILAFGDLHGSYLKVLDYLSGNNLDLIIITGDITDFGPAELGEEILNEISQFNIPLLVIPGNCDPITIHSKIENSKAVNIHGRSVIIKDIGICGFGGSNPTPFNTPLEFEEIQIYEEARKVFKIVSNQKIILFITHAPPYGTKTDSLVSGVHVGSKSIRKVIEEFQPTLNICGHIHESKGVDEIGITQVINPGELSDGYGCLIHIDDIKENPEVKAEIIKL